MLKKFRPYMMPVTMTIGALFYPFFSKLTFLTPYLIFLMLFFPYCGIPLRDIRFKTCHFLLILVQIVGGITMYLSLRNFNLTLAQTGLLCFLTPTATSAVVVTGMLKGSTASLTAYTILSNLMVVILAPFLFSLWGTHADISFWTLFFHIAQRVFLLLLGPLLLATLLRKISPQMAEEVKKKNIISFYIWVFALAIVTGTTVNFIVAHGFKEVKLEILIAILSLFACVFQFYIGRRIGAAYNDKIACGQGLGQKNTIFAIWLAYTYLNPLVSIGPGTYILWQNIINSWQIWRIRKEL